tara:strand:+ start:564 stop:1223 length:660 start_codon:yes stop_codon:yes gene_type:complete
MKKINLLKSLPKPNRKKSKVQRKSKKTKKHIFISRKYGEEYFDGSRDYGYGGYYYDGRWKPVAKDIKKFFKLQKSSKLLDIGCAKGFLINDLIDIDVDAYGLEISKYAIENSMENTHGRIHLGNAIKLPFPSNSFDCVISINTIHNLTRSNCIKSIKEMVRVCKTNKIFIQVDSYLNKKQKKIFEEWVLTAKYHDYPKNWKNLFEASGYKGYYNWTIIK